MDPVTLAAAAVSFVTPYLLDLGKEACKSAAGESGKSVWAWIKEKLVSPAGAKAIRDIEETKEPENLKANEPEKLLALQEALTKVLKADPDGARALQDLLKASGVAMSFQNINIVGDGNGGQASDQSTITINVDRPPSSRA
ncbi:MAG TPA: hypothetical protein VFE60_14200 [Roseiarcus sp.]|jgi:hypothetical protein|nr:hypothetical protein [Roseiarcus sp.]